MTKSSRERLTEKINSFDYWHYPFDLGDGIVITPTHEGQSNKKLQLRDFIWPAALELCGGSLEGLRILDVACNARNMVERLARLSGISSNDLDVAPIIIRDIDQADPGRLLGGCSA